MNNEIKKLAKKAGFIFWKDESHGPGPDHIDWGSTYDDEFEKFATLLIEKCAHLASAKAYGAFEAEKSIRAYFDMASPADTCVLLSPKRK